MEWLPTFTGFYDPLMAGSIDGTDLEPHDGAIVRALNTKYRPNQNVAGRPECSLFVARLSFATTEETIRKSFSEYGDIKRLRLVRDMVTGFSKGYAFVEFVDEMSTRRAWAQANHLVIDDRPVFVDYECERKWENWVPRRLGGGIGGRKESGQLRFGGRDRPFRKPIILPDKFRQEDPDSLTRGSVTMDHHFERGLSHKEGGEDSSGDTKASVRNDNTSSHRREDRSWRRRSRSKDRHERAKRSYRSRSSSRERSDRHSYRKRRERSRSRNRDRGKGRDRANDDDADSARRRGRY